MQIVSRMRTIALFLLLTASFLETPYPQKTEVFLRHSFNETIFHKISTQACYFALGSTSLFFSDLAYLGWGIGQFSPSIGPVRANEFLLFSQLTTSLAKHAFAQILKEFKAPFTPSQ